MEKRKGRVEILLSIGFIACRHQADHEETTVPKTVIDYNSGQSITEKTVTRLKFQTVTAAMHQ